MKHLIVALAVGTGIQTSLPAKPAHLDIMVPDRQDTDLLGPVKSVEVKLWPDLSGQYTTEKREYDRTGNLLKITEHDENGKLVDVKTFYYNESGCYDRMLHQNKEIGFTNEWKVVLNPDTRQIALQEIDGDHVGIETYSKEGYRLHYRMLNKDRQPIITYEYKRDENNRRTAYTRIEGRDPVYTCYYKWADNGFVDMEAQTYHQEDARCRDTYEYLVTDGHGNWTQRIMVRYDISGKKPEKFYEQTVQRKIEYYEDSEGEDEPSSEESGVTIDTSAGTNAVEEPDE